MNERINMSYYYQTVPVNYQVATSNSSYSYTQHAVNAGITGAVVGAVAGTAKGVYQTEKDTQGRVKTVAKVAARDSALCGGFFICRSNGCWSYWYKGIGFIGYFCCSWCRSPVIC